MSAGRDLGERFARALAAKDAASIRSLLAADVDFRGMTPGRTWEVESADQLVDEVLLGTWFASDDHIEGLVSLETDDVASRARVGYQLRVRNDGGLHLVDQQAYLEERDGRIGWLRIMCAGFQPIES